MRFMITDGGPHAVEQWAAVSAEQICDLIEIDQKTNSATAIAARLAKPKLVIALADALLGHHDDVQKQERGAIAKHGHDRLGHSCDPREHCPNTLAAAVNDVVACAAAFPLFKDHFALPGTQDVIRGILGSHFATVMHIERSEHADGHVIDAAGKRAPNSKHDADHPHVKAFCAARNA